MAIVGMGGIFSTFTFQIMTYLVMRGIFNIIFTFQIERMTSMSKIDETQYWVPEHVREYLRSLGFMLPLEAMEAYIRDWHDWLSVVGEFFNYHDTDGFGRIYEVHRRSIHPAMRVCQEWGPLLLNDKTQVVCENQGATDWLSDFLAHRVHAGASGYRGEGFRDGHGRLGALGGCRCAQGSNPSLRCSHGDTSVLGRGGRFGMRVRHAGFLPGQGFRPAADASSRQLGRGRRFPGDTFATFTFHIFKFAFSGVTF